MNTIFFSVDNLHMSNFNWILIKGRILIKLKIKFKYKWAQLQLDIDFQNYTNEFSLI